MNKASLSGNKDALAFYSSIPYNFGSIESPKNAGMIHFIPKCGLRSDTQFASLS